VKEKKILLSAGGSGGHLVPAQMLAKTLLEKNSNLKLLFAAHDLENSSFFQKEKFPYENIFSSPLSKHPFKLFKALVCLSRGFLKGIKVLTRFKPDIVVGFGSYHTFPMLLAACVMRKKLILYESNASLGMVNRFFAKKAKKIVLQLPIEEIYKEKICYAQFLPWGKKPDFLDPLLAREKLSLEKDPFTILVVGGSQGAISINETFLQAAFELKRKGVLFQVIHLIGNKENLQKVEAFYQEHQIPFYVKPFEKEISTLYCAADLAIARSGAGTIGDLVTYQVPAICIPYPFAKENHQEKNALYFTNEIKGGTILLQKDLQVDALLEKIENFLLEDRKKLLESKQNIMRFALAEKKRNRQDLSDIVLKLGE
jgi:UDP-N-acetylglucosamine--N-acetylmuramyl-(pentapeptide) pyrophosphoryl-undecaprenol N-acetylglucosamine transferase